eukprot:13979139-Ditylum_brightwellii.AAC.1
MVALDTDIIKAQEEAEASFFCCDESIDNKEELMKGVEQEAEQAEQNEAEKAGKRKTDAGKEVVSSAAPTKQSRTT